MTTKNNYRQDERLMAALAHGSIVGGQLGIIAAIVVYLNQKDKSVYAARQAAQAAVYQIVGFLGLILGWMCWGAFYFVTFIPVINDPNQFNDAPPPLFWVGLGSMICPLAFMGIWWLYGIFAAIQVWMGKDFKYAVIGNIIEQRLDGSAV
ncbi:MAG: DUF4870 domain-containing protein [Candidatus Promineifilaceae bacterium]